MSADEGGWDVWTEFIVLQIGKKMSVLWGNECSMMEWVFCEGMNVPVREWVFCRRMSVLYGNNCSRRKWMDYGSVIHYLNSVSESCE